MIHVLLDIDKTMLSVSSGIDAHASAVMFKTVFNIEAHEEMIDNTGKTEMGIIQEILALKIPIQKQPPVIPKKAYQLWAQQTAQALEKDLPQILPGIEKLLHGLFQNPKIKLTVLSGNSRDRAKVKIVAAGLERFFIDKKTNLICGVFGDMAATRAQLFEMVKTQLMADDKVIIIDDSLVGAKMAQELAIPILLVATGNATVEQLRGYSPYVFVDFGENRWQEAIKITESLDKN